MKVSDLIARTVPQFVTKAHNLDQIGWCDGYLLVKFKSSYSLWVYGPAIPELKRDQILANPYPDSLFEKAIKSKYQSHKATK